MAKFLLRRMAAVPLTFLVITAVLFAITLLAPLDARATLFLPRNSRMFLPAYMMENAIKSIVHQYGLDDPYPVQYVRWLSQMVRGDWGWSPVLRTGVLEALLARTPATAELTLYSLLLLVPLGLVNGALAGWRQDSRVDHGFRAIAYLATSIPPFILGLVLLSVFYVGFHWFPPGRIGMMTVFEMSDISFRSVTGLLTVDGLLNGRPDITVEALRHLALPVLTLSLAHWATLGRVTRAAMIEQLGKDYIVAAHARGLLNRSIIWRHAFLNAAPPALTATGLSAASLVTGVYVVEAIFSFPGVSQLITRGMQSVPDSALAMGFAVYSVLVVLLMMLVIDVIQALINPLLRQEALNG
jgi:ABC-type dipeptide/oligopeptide/nickel transport system permease component